MENYTIYVLEDINSYAWRYNNSYTLIEGWRIIQFMYLKILILMLEHNN